MFDIDFALCVFIYVCTAFIVCSWCVTIHTKFKLLRLDKEIKDLEKKRIKKDIEITEIEREIKNLEKEKTKEQIEQIEQITKTKNLMQEIYNIITK